MNTSSIDTTIIIPNWNGEKWLGGCLDALSNQDYTNFRTIVVDNGSEDHSRELLRTTYPWVETILLPENKGFACAVNIGIKASRTEYIVLLNNDTIPSREWLNALHEMIQSSPPDVGSLASCMVMMDNPLFIDDAGDILDWFGSAEKRGHCHPVSEYSDAVEVFSACAGAALYRRSALEKTGLFDETFESYLEDIDLGLRLRIAGHRCIYVPQAVIRHKGHGSAILKEKYIINMTRNRTIMFLKNIPVFLLIKHAPLIIAGQVWYALTYHNPRASIRGYGSCIHLIPAMIKEHKRLKNHRILTYKEIEKLLIPKKNTPS